jgi:nitroreductase
MGIDISRIFNLAEKSKVMNFMEIARERYSCRKYQATIPDKETILQLIEAGRVAPSAVNYQPMQFFVVQGTENVAKLAESYSRDWFRLAPVVIVVCGDHELSWKRADGKDHCDIDVAIAADHISLQATAMGLGSCWVCNFDKNKLAQILQLPSHLEPIVMIPFGYPDDQSDPLRHFEKRKPLIDIVQWKEF